MSKVSIDGFDIQYGNDIAVYVDELERVAAFLHDELIVYFPGLFDKVEKHS
ncbi:hypothetical protein ABNJ79_004396 [Vibrio vulnificus]|jgi:hypothetical protein